VKWDVKRVSNSAQHCKPSRKEILFNYWTSISDKLGHNEFVAITDNCKLTAWIFTVKLGYNDHCYNEFVAITDNCKLTVWLFTVKLGYNDHDNIEFVAVTDNC